jgi:hypothetical protein
MLLLAVPIARSPSPAGGRRIAPRRPVPGQCSRGRHSSPCRSPCSCSCSPSSAATPTPPASPWRTRTARSASRSPVARAGDVPGADGGLRIFSYNDALPAYVFLPALIVAVGLVALGALYGGFAAARAAPAHTLAAGAAWGALTGPVWAVTTLILNALAGGTFHGAAAGGSVFAVFLLGGALLGPGGGALARG